MKGKFDVYLKFMFSKKATKIEEIFTVNLTVCSKCQIDGEDFVKFCGLLKKHELYKLKRNLEIIAKFFFNYRYLMVK